MRQPKSKLSRQKKAEGPKSDTWYETKSLQLHLDIMIQSNMPKGFAAFSLEINQ
jgi:hypothetical protein